MSFVIDTRGSSSFSKHNEDLNTEKSDQSDDGKYGNTILFTKSFTLTSKVAVIWFSLLNSRDSCRFKNFSFCAIFPVKGRIILTMAVFCIFRFPVYSYENGAKEVRYSCDKNLGVVQKNCTTPSKNISSLLLFISFYFIFIEHSSQVLQYVLLFDAA